MDTFILARVEPTDGTPYQQLINTSRVGRDITLIAGIVDYRLDAFPSSYKWVIDTNAATTPVVSLEDVSAYVMRECVNANGVTGPVQVAPAPKAFTITKISLTQ